MWQWGWEISSCFGSKSANVWYCRMAWTVLSAFRRIGRHGTAHLSQSHSRFRLSQSFWTSFQLFSEEAWLFTVFSNKSHTYQKGEELSPNNLKLTQTIHSSTKRLSRLLLATSGHIKPSQRLHCQVGQSRNTKKDQEPKSAPTPSHQKWKST